MKTTAIERVEAFARRQNKLTGPLPATTDLDEVLRLAKLGAEVERTVIKRQEGDYIAHIEFGGTSWESRALTEYLDHLLLGCPS